MATQDCGVHWRISSSGSGKFRDNITLGPSFLFRVLKFPLMTVIKHQSCPTHSGEATILATHLSPPFVVQSLSHVQLCDPVEWSTPGFSVLHHLQEFAQTHVHQVSDNHSLPHPLSSPSPPAVNLSQHQSLLASGGQSTEALASVLPMNIQGWFPLGLTALFSLQSMGLSRVFSSIIIRKHQLLVLSLLSGPTLTSIHDYWENQSFDYLNLCWQSNVSAF